MLTFVDVYLVTLLSVEPCSCVNDKQQNDFKCVGLRQGCGGQIVFYMARLTNSSELMSGCYN